MQNKLLGILTIVLIGVFAANAEESVKKLYINIPQPPQKKIDTIDEKKAEETPPLSSPGRHAPDSDINKLLNEGPFNVFANPKFKKFMEFLTNKKMIESMNRLADKNKLRFMIIGQIVLIVLSLILRSIVTTNTRGFFSTLVANTWVAGVHLFLATVVLPRFLYGPHYFEVIAELYKIISAGQT
ncbi:MAG: hypothetical protein A4S09_07990 [Proteobacteria bacterium SG_bin7]|nr:MAG: hypothetical protein A4S09_07990 [Proteobacteria bacterium SG_bin7]